jgi:dipeptidyl aminopeptidase/acylaminoacyl peptidase
MRWLILGLALVLGVAGAAAAAPLEAYGRLPAVEAVEISPSGHAVALSVTNGEQRIIVVQQLADNTVTLRGFVGEHKLRAVRWAGDQHLILAYSATTTAFEVVNGRGEWLFGSLVNLRTKEIKPLMRNTLADLQMIFEVPTTRQRNGETRVFAGAVVFRGNRGRLSLFGVDPAAGTNRLLLEGSDDTVGWVVDPEGEPLARQEFNRGSGAWSLLIRDQGRWREAATARSLLDPPFVVGLSRDGAGVIYSQGTDEGARTWTEVRRDGGPAPPPVTVRPNEAPVRDRDGRLIGTFWIEGDEEIFAFDGQEDQRVWKAVVAAFPGARVSLESWSADRRKIVVRVQSPNESPAFALVDVNARSARWLGEQYPGLKAPDISTVRPIRFKAADGLELTGYLTLPQGRDPKNLPLVVLPHGGPASRDTLDFDWWSQGMASRGYAVLKVNFRGSAGLGRAHLEAGWGQWGRKMQTDLSDGVRHLAGQGLIDPKRVCIVGGSYGGYAALAGTTLDRGVYRCAVSVAGVTDLAGMIAFGTTRGGTSTRRYWMRFMGAETGDDPVLKTLSPVHLADRADAPILLIHGKDDTVVPADQSQRMADALKKAGKPVELILQKGADHWLSRGDTRLETLTATMAFVEKHNPPN